MQSALHPCALTLLRRLTRGAALGLALAVAALCATTSAAQERITSAGFTEPTSRYAHAVLGDAIEYGALELRTETANGATRTLILRLPEHRVFEDIAPRLFDLDKDGRPEVIAVQSDAALGARLVVYGPTGLIAATPHIGQKNRWLAPIGAADLDGDGFVEIAYIDRPHLAKTLRLWRFKDGALTEVASKTGLTNHKIGWDFIAGGLRHCADLPEIITANANWTRILATEFDGQSLTSREIGAYSGPQNLTKALSCP
ncbi:FG-GAP repeat domain-containing protein [Lentibacter sp.]|uniref:FG-GAP repeat domain-containing protein n=1 Tax=Lentibacter sp. TaxID=2024994 RepID=UPI003F6A42BF